MLMNKHGSTGLALYGLLLVTAIAGAVITALGAIVLGILYFTGHHNRWILWIGIACLVVCILLCLAFLGLKS